jgi:hypothetical protein
MSLLNVSCHNYSTSQSFPYGATNSRSETSRHRLHKEIDLQSLFELMCTYSCNHWMRDPATPTPPPLPHLGSYTRALLVSQHRRHLFVTLCFIGLYASACTDKKENKIFLISKEIQKGSGAKSYMTNGLSIYD